MQNNNKEQKVAWCHARVLAAEGALIDDAVVLAQDGKITFVGKEEDAPSFYDADEVYDLKGALLTPALVDCHTQLAFGLPRRSEPIFSDLENLNNVLSVSQMDFQTLCLLTKQRLLNWLSQGATTCEVQSGEGFDFDTERKLLLALKKCQAELPITIQKTFLVANTLPPSFSNEEEYLKVVINDWLPTLVEEYLIDAVGISCHTSFFGPHLLEKFFKAAKRYRLPIKANREQICFQSDAHHATQLTTLFNGSQWDEQITQTIAAKNMVAVLLPTAKVNMDVRSSIDMLRKNGVKMALASAHQPGVSSLESLNAVMQLASSSLHLTAQEVWLGFTHHAAKTLGLKDKGSIALEKDADLIVWDADDLNDTIHNFNEVTMQVFSRGQKVSFKATH